MYEDKKHLKMAKG